MEHFDEERIAENRLHGVLLIRWGLGFAALFVLGVCALWWSGSAVRYGAARVHGIGEPTYQVRGTVRDSVTKHPVPWASITTEITFGPQFFETNADDTGAYTLMTMAEPHKLIVRANGYRETRVPVGKQWFSWLPKGAEERDIMLTPR